MFTTRLASLILIAAFAAATPGCNPADDQTDDGKGSNRDANEQKDKPVADSVNLLTENTPPVNYLDADGKPAGVAVELVREIARRVGHSGQIKVVPWARGYKDTQEISNTALFSTYRSAARESMFKWVGPLLVKEAVLYRKKGGVPRISSLDDAKKVGSIGAYINDSKEQFLKKNGFTNLDSSPDDLANPRKLVAGRIDLWISTSVQVNDTCKLAGVNPADIEPALVVLRQPMYLAFSIKTDDAVVDRWRKAFAEMEKDGTVQKIRQKLIAPR